MKNMSKRTWLLVILLLALSVPARVVDVDQFATIDEPWWVISGANFYYALTHREFENTIYDYHPAVTTTWVVTAGMVLYYPEYRIHAPGYFDVRKPLFENFMRAQGKDTQPLVRLSRLIQIATLAFFTLLIFFLLRLLMDERAAFLAVALANAAPFFTGMSRLLNHEALLATFSLTALLALQVYLNRERQWIYLALSGAAFGLAQLTKSSSIVLLPLAGLMLFVVILRRGEKTFGAKILDAGKIFALWLGCALLTYILLWPGTWVAPLKMFNEVYGNAFSYALQGSRTEAALGVAAGLTLAERARQAAAFSLQWLHNSTPLSALGLIFALALFLTNDRELARAPLRSTLAYLLTLAALVILLFSVSSGRDSQHYVLTSYASLDLLAGIGWAYIILWAQKKWDGLSRAFFLPLAFSALLAFQLGSALAQRPYYYTYKNPFATWGGIHGYGEGLDLAAEYLSQKPDAQNSYAIVYAGRGCFSYGYPGRTEHMKVGVKDGLPFIEDVQNADYFVTYDIYQQHKPDGLTLIHFLKAAAPERVIVLDGIEYARIYKVADLPPDVLSALTQK